MDSLSSHLAPLHTPARTVQDADRDIADLRLAMVGMGKTMANWLETVEESCGIVSEGRLETALQGLRRLRETLINGATTTTTELAKDWAWSHELATTPSIYSTVSTDSPLDTDGVPLEALAGDMTTSSGINQQSAGPPHQEKDAIPTDTFPLGSTPSTASSPMYLQSPSNFSRTPRSQYTSHTASSQRVAPTRNAQEPALSLHESTDFQMERRPIANDTQFQESAATPSLKIAERETFSVQARNLHNVDVDPLSGQVTVTGEHGSSVYGLKRLSRDPLKGLGIL
ncbi:hypothetical protein QFC19_004185 [Naganishia cerealis]|uniref:Uncharacterized protein n=1 Tax=Naganishia cerealis TaxID=610337 RepID=A0ACC2VZK3_9TREE|nr:hypothetical protein QFC19_004185 [Naganishia cerealis]